MKRYIQIALFALIAQCGLSNIAYAISIAPTTTGDDAIVNAIKQYSDLTEADVNQYKLLWLGSLGTAGAFLAGAASTVGAGFGTYQNITPEISQKITELTPEKIANMKGWLSNPIVLAGLGTVGAGYLSYRILYPRIRAGVLNKVERYIDVCKGVNLNSWSSSGDVAIYNALNNLATQGKYAQLLLNQIEPAASDPLIQEKRETVRFYTDLFTGDKEKYRSAVQGKQKAEEKERQKERQIAQEKLQEKRQNIEIADLEANARLKQQGASLAQAKTVETWMQIVGNTARNFWNGINYMYENKYNILGGAVAGVASTYGMYWYLKTKLAGQ